MASATTCKPISPSSTSTGADTYEAMIGRSVGAGRGAGGVSREADTLVGSAAAIARAVAVGSWMISGISVAGGVEVAVAVGVSVG